MLLGYEYVNEKIHHLKIHCKGMLTWAMPGRQSWTDCSGCIFNGDKIWS